MWRDEARKGLVAGKPHLAMGLKGNWSAPVSFGAVVTRDGRSPLIGDGGCDLALEPCVTFYCADAGSGADRTTPEYN